jgi:hypothetical protein
MIRLHRDERGQSLPIVLALITVIFLMGSALAAHASVALRTTVANEGQAGDLYAADAGAELGMWWQRNGNSGLTVPPITVNGLPVAASFTSTTVPCPTPSPVALTGFEHGAASASGGGIFAAMTGPGLSADTVVRRTGTYSLKVIANGAAANNASLTIDTPAPGVAVVRVYVRLASDPAADVNELMLLDAGAGNDLRLGYRASTNKLTLRFGALAVTVGSTTITAGTWYRIDIRFIANANPRTAAWQIDGTGQTLVTDVAEAGSTVGILRFGSTISADTFTANYDDVLISATTADYPIGAGTVIGLRPDGIGTNSGAGSFTEEDGTAIDANSYTHVDDNLMTGIADYIIQPTAAAGSYIEVTFADTVATCVVGVSGVLAYHAPNNFTNDGQTRVVDGTTERVLYDGDMGINVVSYKSAVIAPTAASWTPTTVNGLRARIGYSTDANPDPYWDALRLEVATGIGVPGTVTVTSQAGSSTVTTTYPDVGSLPPALSSWTTSQ